MHWNTAIFTEVHTSIVAAGCELTSSLLLDLVSPVMDDIKALLSYPPKSEVSRQKLASKTLEIEDEKISVTDEFLNIAARVADELNLDELVAAEIVYFAAKDAKRLNVNVFESSIALFYYRRQFIIDLYRFCAEELPQSVFDSAFKIGMKIEQILEALQASEKNMEDLNEKAKTGEFMGFGSNVQFRQLLSLQRGYLVQEHESLGNILYILVSKPNGKELENADLLIKILKHVSSFQTLDSKLFAYFASLNKWLSQPFSNEFTLKIWQFWETQHGSNSSTNSSTNSGTTGTTMNTTSGWKLGTWQSALSLMFYIGLSDEVREPSSPIPYDDICRAAKLAIDNGALEFLMSMHQDIGYNCGEAFFERFWPLLRFRVGKFTFWQTLPSKPVLQSITMAFKQIVTGFITNLADILKEMRLSEEDMYLALADNEEETKQVSPGTDLERFILLVASVYKNDPKATKEFFEDESGALYGFLMWGRDFQVTFMTALFTEMLSCLANSVGNACSVHKFMLEAELSFDNGSRDDKFTLCWSGVYDVIEYYIRGATPVPGTANANNVGGNPIGNPIGGNPTGIPGPANVGGAPLSNIANTENLTVPTSSGLKSTNQVLNTTGTSGTSVSISGNSGTTGTTLVSQELARKLSNDTLLMISAYLHLLSRVAVYCEPARNFLRKRVSKDQESMDIVPLLFRVLKANLKINDSVFTALMPFASKDLWIHLDQIVLNKFDEFLNSLQDTQAFVELCMVLIKLDEFESVNWKTANLYIQFIITGVFVATCDLDRQLATKVSIRHACLEILKTVLLRSPLNSEVFKLCFEPKVYNAIFQVLTTGVDALTDLDDSHPLVKTVCLSVNIVSILLKLSQGPTWSFDKAVLYHLQVVPHVAMYIGSGLKKLSLSSVQLLMLLDESPEFKPNVSRQSRILSILSSTTESARIRVDIMTCLRDPYSDLNVKQAILHMILKELLQMETAKYTMTVGHHLLGFNQAELGMELKIELDSNTGGIKTGNSTFGVVCEILLACLISGGRNVELLCLSSAIIGTLVKNKLTSEIILDYLRENEFFLDIIRMEPEFLPINQFELLCEYRSMMLEIWALELKACQEKLLLTVENHYLSFLAPRVFTMLDFSRLPNGGGGNAISDGTDSGTVNGTVNGTTSGSTTGSGNSSSTLLRCLKGWCALIPIMIITNRPQTGSSFVSQVMKLLVQHLEDYSRLDTEFAKPVAKLLALLIEKCRSGHEEIMSLYIDSLFKVSLDSIQPSQALSDLRLELYSICSKCLQIKLESSSDINDYVDIILQNGPRFFTIVCDDILGRQADDVQLSALIFLQLSVIAERRAQSSNIIDLLIRQNFIPVFVTQLLSKRLTLRDDFSTQITKISLALLLQTAQTRPGSVCIISSGFFPLIESVASKLSRDQLSVALKVVIAVVVVMGIENKSVLEAGSKVLSRNPLLVDHILQLEADSKLGVYDLNVELARNIRTLTKLTSEITK